MRRAEGVQPQAAEWDERICGVVIAGGQEYAYEDPPLALALRHPKAAYKTILGTSFELVLTLKNGFYTVSR